MPGGNPRARCGQGEVWSEGTWTLAMLPLRPPGTGAWPGDHHRAPVWMPHPRLVKGFCLLVPQDGHKDDGTDGAMALMGMMALMVMVALMGQWH